MCIVYCTILNIAYTNLDLFHSCLYTIIVFINRFILFNYLLILNLNFTVYFHLFLFYFKVLAFNLCNSIICFCHVYIHV